MKFLGLVTSFDEKKDVVHASILDPKPLRGSTIHFHISKVQTEQRWRRPLPTKTSLFVGERQGDEVLTNVEFIPRQQFRGTIDNWDPVYMRATVRYPEIQENHVHDFNTPWLARGDRIIVEGTPGGLEWSVGDFRLHRRVQTFKLETGAITSLFGERGNLMSPSGDDLEFGCQDVLLCDCRDFYPESLRQMRYLFELENTFEVGEQVFFIRAQDEDLERCNIKVFVPRTEFGLLDPIFDSVTADPRFRCAIEADPCRPSFRGSCNQIPCEEASFPCCLEH